MLPLEHQDRLTCLTDSCSARSLRPFRRGYEACTVPPIVMSKKYSTSLC